MTFEICGYPNQQVREKYFKYEHADFLEKVKLNYPSRPKEIF